MNWVNQTSVSVGNIMKLKQFVDSCIKQYDQKSIDLFLDCYPGPSLDSINAEASRQ